MKRYLRIFRGFFKASFIADIEYRANFLTRITTDIFWYLAQIIVFEALYQHTDKIGSWNVHQTRVFLGVLFIVDAFYMILFSENLDRLSEKVRRGDLDMLLTKPVNSQFVISCQRISTALFGNLILGVSWLTFSLWSLPDFNPWKLLWLLVFVPCGLITVYALRFVFSAISVIFARSESFQYLWYQIYRLGVRPDTIYAPWLKMVVLTALPVAVIASVPSRALLDPPNYVLFAWVICWTAVILYGSHRFWRFSLRHYSSASS